MLIQAVNGCVLATEKKNKSILFEDHSTYKIEQVLIIYVSCLLYYFLCQSCYCIARTVSTYMSNCVSLQITGNIGMVYSGMGPDYRLLIRRARKMAQVVHAP